MTLFSRENKTNKEYTTHIMGEDIPVLMTVGDYTRFLISERAVNMYNERAGTNYPYKPFGTHVKRHDPILIEIFKEIGHDAFVRCETVVALEYIPAKYLNYYRIVKPAGAYEDIFIDEQRYLRDKLKSDILEIMDSELFPDPVEKLAIIRKFIEHEAAAP